MIAAVELALACAQARQEATRQAAIAQQEAAARAQAWNQQVDMEYGNAYQSPWNQTGQDCLRQPKAIPKPCPYCKRTKQTPGHQSCDGCGAPR